MPDAPPVFVDPTGRRRRRVRVTAIVASASLLGAGALIVAALLGVPVGPAAYLPEPEQSTPPTTNQQPAVAETPRDAVAPSSRRAAPAGGRPGTAARVPVPASAPPVTTATTAGRGKPQTPPGRPSDLPTPPGHTR
jgi:hypothetical protein